MIVFELKTTGSNPREIWQARHGRVKRERKAAAEALRNQVKPAIPCTVLLVRYAQSAGLDDDNLRAALKGVRDEVAAWLGVDDRHSKQVQYAYSQARGVAGVGIEFGAASSGAQLTLLGETVLGAAA